MTSQETVQAKLALIAHEQQIWESRYGCNNSTLAFRLHTYLCHASAISIDTSELSASPESSASSESSAQKDEDRDSDINSKLSGLHLEEKTQGIHQDAVPLPSAIQEYIKTSKEQSNNDSDEEMPRYSLGSDLSALVDNTRFADLVFEVEGTRIPAHKAILCARCPHFCVRIPL